jgi:Zn-dependent metalloprotease
MMAAGISEVPTGTKRRAVYDAHHTLTLPGKLVRGETDPATTDKVVNRAFEGLGATYDLYDKAFNRTSIDGRGLRLNASVHYSKNYDNAFWDGRQMVFGDGDGQIFRDFTSSIDVIGHELTHGVTQYTAELEYQDESGALNESMSDVFGSLVKQHSLNQTAEQADWLIGAGLFTPAIHGDALRSMKAPGTAYDDELIGKDPQPGHMRDFVHTSEDNGGVHINSGIPNKAFYLCAMEIGGVAWEMAGKIWYIALSQRLTRVANFEDAARATLEVASTFGTREATAVANAWQGVGVSVPALIGLKRAA